MSSARDVDRSTGCQSEAREQEGIEPLHPQWAALVAECNGGQGLGIWQAVVESAPYVDALDELLALWLEVFQDWLTARGRWMSPVSPDDLICSLELRSVGELPHEPGGL